MSSAAFENKENGPGSFAEVSSGKSTLPLRKQIISLYKEGKSQSDIRRICGASLKIVNQTLIDAGFNPMDYRKIPEECKKIFFVLWRHGVTYQKASNVMDLSFDAVRDFVERTPKIVRTTYMQPNFDVSEDHKALVNMYVSGLTFFEICAKEGLDDERILQFYSLLSPEVLRKHSNKLCRRLRRKDMNRNTVYSLARKYGISVSVVKAHLNS